jgi:predicted SprT family Zn-dependent metalloprotease
LRTTQEAGIDHRTVTQAPLPYQHLALALAALSRDWAWLNESLFRSQMRIPQFVLATGTSFMARWHRSTRTMEFADATLRDHPWGVVTEVLKHEMAHQFVDEVLKRTEETAHGPAFREVCDARNIDARSAGVPEARRVRSDEETAVMERIRKLLALAESPNEHEAQAAMNAAQRLMLKYNLDAVSQRASRGHGYKHLGAPTGRVDEAQRMLALILLEHFFVETIWVPVWRVHEARTGSVLEVCGTPENLEMAEYVHSF